MMTEDTGRTLSSHLDQDELANALQKALRQTLFSSRLRISPRRVKEIGQEVAADFLRFLETKDEEATRAYGQHLVAEGLGHRSILMMTEALRQVCRAHSNPSPMASVAGEYVVLLLEGYMAQREEHLLEEQARTQRALERAQAR
jgi:hypothetical protein